MLIQTRDGKQVSEILGIEDFDFRTPEGTLLGRYQRMYSFPHITYGPDEVDMAEQRLAKIEADHRLVWAHFDVHGLCHLIEDRKIIWERPVCVSLTDGSWGQPVVNADKNWITISHHRDDKPSDRDYSLSDYKGEFHIFFLRHVVSTHWASVSFFESLAWQQLQEEYPSARKHRHSQVKIAGEHDRALMKLRANYFTPRPR